MKLRRKKLHLSFDCSVFILESAFGFIEVTRVFRSIEPAVVQGIQMRVPNSRNSDGRVDFHIVQWKGSSMSSFSLSFLNWVVVVFRVVVCHGRYINLVIQVTVRNLKV